MITAIISIFLIGILTKYLPIELYGSYNKVYSYLGIFAFLADLGLYTIAIREISQAQTPKEKIIGNILTLRTLLGLIIWILALLIALFLPGYHSMLTLGAIAIVGLFTLISLINSSLLALMQSQMQMEFSVVSLVAGKILNLAMIAFFLIFLFHGNAEKENIAFISVFIAGLCGVILNTALNYLYARRICRIGFLCDLLYIKHIFQISLPYGVALFLSVVYFKVDVILLSILEPPQKADISIALYGLPMKIIEVLMVLGGFYLNSLLPTLTEKFQQRKYEDISKIFGMSVKILFSFGLLIFLLGNLLASETMSIIATPEYIHPIGHIYNSVQAFKIVLAVLLFYFLSLNFIYMLIASHRQSLLLWINLGVTLVNIIGNIIIIPYYSFIGSAYITLLSQIFLLICTGYVVLQKISIPIKYIKSMIFAGIWAILCFLFFQKMLFYFDASNIIKIISVAPLFVIAYIIGEIIFSRKLFSYK